MGIHSHHIWTVVLITLWSQSQNVAPTSSGVFDCRRSGQDVCQNNAQCSSKGVCECSSGWEGYKCHIETAQVDASKCNPACISGKCVVSASSPPVCMCDAFHIDENICGKLRYKVECDSTTMSINIVPIGTFPGSMYMKGFQDTCQFKKASEQTGLPSDFTDGYARVIPNEDTNCGDAVSKTEGKEVKIVRQVYLQYNLAFAASIDQIVQAECSYTTGQTVVFESTFHSILPSSLENTDQDGSWSVRITAGSKINPLRLTVLRDGAQVTGATPIRLGTVLTLELNVFPEEDFEDFRIETLTIDNNKEGSEKKLISVIASSCHIGGDINGVMPKPVRTAGSLKTVFTFTTIKFSKSTELRIKFDAKMCPKGDKSGCVVSCPGSRRRRRAASESIRTIEVVMKIWDDRHDEQTDGLQTNQKPDGVAQSDDTTALFGLSRDIFGWIIALGVLTIVLIIVVAVGAWRILRSKKEKFQHFS